MIANLSNQQVSWSRRLSLVGLPVLALLFLASTAVHIATLLGMRVDSFIPRYLGGELILGLLIVRLLTSLYGSRQPAGANASHAVVWVPSRPMRWVLWVLYLAFLAYAVWTIFFTPGYESGLDPAEAALRQWRRDSATLMVSTLVGLFMLAEYALGWQLLGARATGPLTAEQTRQWHWYGFSLAGLGFGASLLVYGMSFGGVLPEPLWLVGWFAIAAVLLLYLGYLLTPQAPEPYPVRPLPGWVHWVGQVGIILLMMNIAVSVAMFFLSGGTLGALRITAAIFLLVYFVIARLIAAYRLGWSDLMPPSSNNGGA